MRPWRPANDLGVLLEKLAAEIIGAPDEEILRLSKESGHSIIGAAGDRRDAMAAGGRSDLKLAETVSRPGLFVRQH